MAIALGIIGAGNIFPAYLRTLKRSRLFRIVGVADAVPAAAQKRAEEMRLRQITFHENKIKRLKKKKFLVE